MDAGSIPAVSTITYFVAIFSHFFILQVTFWKHKSRRKFVPLAHVSFTHEPAFRSVLACLHCEIFRLLPECLNRHFPPCPPCKQKKSLRLFFVYNEIEPYGSMKLLRNDICHSKKYFCKRKSDGSILYMQNNYERKRIISLLIVSNIIVSATNNIIKVIKIKNT